MDYTAATRSASPVETFAVDWVPRVLSILRIVAGLLIIEHGSQKLFGFPTPSPAMGGTPAIFSLIWYAAVLEFFGGLLVLVGLVTRLAAFVLSGEMAVAYWMAHASRGPFPALNGGDAAILFCFIFLFLAAAGGGAWSLDQLRQRRGVI